VPGDRRCWPTWLVRVPSPQRLCNLVDPGVPSRVLHLKASEQPLSASSRKHRQHTGEIIDVLLPAPTTTSPPSVALKPISLRRMGPLGECRGRRPGIGRSCSAQGPGDGDTNGSCGFVAGRLGLEP